MFCAAFVWDFKAFIVVAFVVVFGMVLAYRLVRRDVNVRRIRYGFFVERDRYDDDEEENPSGLPSTETKTTKTETSEKVTEAHQAWPVHGWSGVPKPPDDE
jgi:hypothetical protein